MGPFERNGYQSSCLTFMKIGVMLRNFQRRQVEPNSMWQHRLTRPLHTAYGNSQTKLILNYFKRGSTLNLNGFSVKIFFYIRYKVFLNFFICSCKITCKPMGKFAENLNLGKCVLPPWKLCKLELLERRA